MIPKLEDYVGKECQVIFLNDRNDWLFAMKGNLYRHDANGTYMVLSDTASSFFHINDVDDIRYELDILMIEVSLTCLT